MRLKENDIMNSKSKFCPDYRFEIIASSTCNNVWEKLGVKGCTYLPLQYGKKNPNGLKPLDQRATQFSTFYKSLKKIFKDYLEALHSSAIQFLFSSGADLLP